MKATLRWRAATLPGRRFRREQKDARAPLPLHYAYAVYLATTHAWKRCLRQRLPRSLACCAILPAPRRRLCVRLTCAACRKPLFNVYRGRRHLV